MKFGLIWVVGCFFCLTTVVPSRKSTHVGRLCLFENIQKKKGDMFCWVLVLGVTISCNFETYSKKIMFIGGCLLPKKRCSLFINFSLGKVISNINHLLRSVSKRSTSLGFQHLRQEFDHQAFQAPKTKESSPI